MPQTGHRQRIKNRFRKEGLDGFEDKHALELLLCYGLPRKDTKPLAEELIENFGGLTQVLDASTEQLEKVPGVGENLSTFLVLVREFVRRYNIAKSSADGPLSGIDDYCNYLKPYFDGKRNEEVYLLCLDAKFKPICCRKIAEGSVHSASVSVRKIAEVVLNINATTIVLAHNHPGGIALPSDEDIHTTHHLAQALSGVDIVLADHVVVADDDAISMVASRLYDPRKYANIG